MPSPLRYAVVGLGWISQVAVLPAFANARNARLAALVSGDAAKMRQLGRDYGVGLLYSYDQFDECLRSGEIDAIYLALPNHLHKDYTVRAARAGIHILCEKPMAVTEQDCREMLQAASKNRVKLMLAYRLHFEAANLQAIAVAESGALGEPRYFNSVFSQQVPQGNIRLKSHDLGGGALYDIGVYCINAARYLFRDEPVEVLATLGNNGEPRFQASEEAASAVLHFPAGRLAAFTCSFGAASTSEYRLVGTRGDLRVEPAYLFQGERKHFLTRDGHTEERVFPEGDQFGPQLDYFSKCILENREPGPNGREGLADVRIIRALYQSAAVGRPVTLPPFAALPRPSPADQIDRPAVREPSLIHAKDPSRAA